MYQIKIASRKVEKQLAKLPKLNRQQILQAIQALSSEPRPSNIKQLGRNIYRLRVGNYRVIYKVFDGEQVILIGKIDRRRERTYRNWERLFRSE